MDNTLLFVSNFISLLIGIGVGYIFTRVERHAREAVKEVHDLKELIHVSEDPKVHHRTSWFKRNHQNLKDIGIFLCVLLAFVAAYISGQYAYQSSEEQAEAERERLQLEWISTCQQDVISQTVEALKARSIFTEQMVAARLRLNTAQAEFLHTIMDPASTPQEEAEAAQSYVQKLDEDIRAGREMIVIRKTNPFPTTQEVDSCMHPPEDPPE